MVKFLIVAASLALASGAAFAQASASEGASAPSKHRLVQKYKAAKARHPPASATSPEGSPDKKGGG